MTGRLKVYDADTGLWQYVDGAGAQANLLRFVPVSPPISVVSTSTTANIAQTHSRVLTELPTNAVAVSTYYFINHSVVSNGLRLNMHPYGDTNRLAGIAGAPAANIYIGLPSHYVPLGGDRQFDYSATIGTAGTMVYAIEVNGYWVVDVSTAIASGGGSIIGYGTSFPGAPLVNDRFFRTDIGMEFFWNGTQWVSSAVHPHRIGYAATSGLSATSPDLDRTGPPPMPQGITDILYVSISIGFIVSGGTALSAANKWTVVIFANAMTGGGAGAALFTKAIDTPAWNSWTRFDATLNILQSSLTSALGFFNIQSTKLGTPGTFYFYPTVSYRYVAT